MNELEIYIHIYILKDFIFSFEDCKFTVQRSKESTGKLLKFKTI